jgi:hypothetical protein
LGIELGIELRIGRLFEGTGEHCKLRDRPVTGDGSRSDPELASCDRRCPCVLQDRSESGGRAMVAPSINLFVVRRDVYNRFVLAATLGVVHGVVLVGALALAFLANVPVIALVFFFATNLVVALSAFGAWNRLKRDRFVAAAVDSGRE